MDNVGFVAGERGTMNRKTHIALSVKKNNDLMKRKHEHEWEHVFQRTVMMSNIETYFCKCGFKKQEDAFGWEEISPIILEDWAYKVKIDVIFVEE